MPLLSIYLHISHHCDAECWMFVTMSWFWNDEKIRIWRFNTDCGFYRHRSTCKSSAHWKLCYNPYIVTYESRILNEPSIFPSNRISESCKTKTLQIKQFSFFFLLFHMLRYEITVYFEINFYNFLLTKKWYFVVVVDFFFLYLFTFVLVAFVLFLFLSPGLKFMEM